MRRAGLWLPISLLLAGCGLREPLEPPAGEPLPPAPAMARGPLATEEMLTPPPIARPDRVDELLRRSEPRESDRFDLPPPDEPPTAAPPPAEDSEDPQPE